MSANTDLRLYRLFQLAQQLLVLEPKISAGTALIEPFMGVFGITAVCLYDAMTDRTYSMGSGGAHLEEVIRGAFISGQDQDDSSTGTAIRRLATQDRVTGAIAFQGLENPELTATALAALAGSLHEGIRLRHQVTEDALAAEMDAFRQATFDVLGNECKNALTTILAATGGLREAGPLRMDQLEMAKMVEEEASRLGNLVSRLDWIVRLDQGDVQPEMDSTNLTTLVAQVVDQWSRISPDRQILFATAGEPFTTLADPELLRLALSQLLDNACKFSAGDAAVHVEVKIEALAGGRLAVIRVFSEGTPIPAHEQRRIFERFYKGARSSNFAIGSGLGLYAARKIAIAHGGTLDLDPEKMRTHCVAFRLCLAYTTDPVDA